MVRRAYDPASSPTSTSSGGMIPWMVMGFSMGIGYFGVESLLWWYKTRRQSTQTTTTTTRRRVKSPLYHQLVRQLAQMENFLAFGNVQHWLLRSWTLPLSSSYDLLAGVFVAVLPATPHDHVDPAKGAARVLSTSNNNNKVAVPPNNDQDVFLTLPPQLHAARVPSTTNNNKGNTNTTKAAKKERYLELLLHNVSHTDLVLGLESTTATTGTGTSSTTTAPSSLNSMCLGRPRFSAFDMYCRKMLHALELDEKKSSTTASPKSTADIVLVPQYQRSQMDARYTIQPHSTDRPHVATGFCWKNNSANTNNRDKEETESIDNSNPRVIPLTKALADLRVRGKDIARLDPCHETTTNNTNMAASTCSDSHYDPNSSPNNNNDRAAHWSMVSPDGTDATTLAADLLSSSLISLPNREDVSVELKAIFFPLLATLIPRWHAQIAQKYKHHNNNNSNSKFQIHKVLVLVTGVGTPRNFTHSIKGNSTELLAHLMERFLAKVYPDITVVKIHSDTNIFRYDDNILFVQQQLLPTVNAYRDAHATQAPYPHELDQNVMGLPTTDDGAMEMVDKPTPVAGNKTHQMQQPNIRTNTVHHFSHEAQPFDVDWKQSFAVTLSFADGSPARTHAIQTALRIYRPAYFHIWQLKTFWHERKIVDDDVEVHSFEEMETSPALESKEIPGELAQVVQEMQAFRQEMTETLLNSEGNDFNSFWLRKTHKPVLAVLLVQTADGPPVLYRGTNMEVSMPTGSLCAERNVIGTALASNPKLKREDLKCIAVLAVPQPPKLNGPPRPPRSSSIGSGSDMICASVKSQNSFDASNAASNNNMAGRQMQRQSFDEREEEWMLSERAPNNNKATADSKESVEIEMDNQADVQTREEASTPLRQISLFKTESSNSLVDMIKQMPTVSGNSPHGDPRRSSSSTAPAKESRRTVLVRSSNHDINPLRPCGACHEWLKKIAECNPYFQILTFTDADCNGVYVTPCQE